MSATQGAFWALIGFAIAHGQITTSAPSDPCLTTDEIILRFEADRESSNATWAGYCHEHAAYPIARSALSSVTLHERNRLALEKYQEELAIWKTKPNVDCTLQDPGRTMCSNCLAIQKRWHCAHFFPKCLPDDRERKVCSGLCEERAWRCRRSSATCDERDLFAEEDCSPGARAGRAPTRLATALALGAVVALTLADRGAIGSARTSGVV